MCIRSCWILKSNVVLQIVPASVGFFRPSVCSSVAQISLVAQIKLIVSTAQCEKISRIFCLGPSCYEYQQRSSTEDVIFRNMLPRQHIPSSGLDFSKLRQATRKTHTLRHGNFKNTPPVGKPTPWEMRFFQDRLPRTYPGVCDFLKINYAENPHPWLCDFSIIGYPESPYPRAWFSRKHIWDGCDTQEHELSIKSNIGLWTTCISWCLRREATMTFSRMLDGKHLSYWSVVWYFITNPLCAQCVFCWSLYGNFRAIGWPHGTPSTIGIKRETNKGTAPLLFSVQPQEGRSRVSHTPLLTY